MKKLISIATFFIVGCSSAPKETISTPVLTAPPRQTTEKSTNVDEQGLQSSLGLDRDKEDLGFQEKAFDTCDVGYGYSSTHNCERQHFVVIHYRLQCRDSEGTVSEALTADDLRPLADRDVRWTLPGGKGVSHTDGAGFGKIAGIFPNSQRKQRLKLGSGGDFLYVRAGELQRIVTPKSWCPY